jgi:hypothetical protein
MVIEWWIEICRVLNKNAVKWNKFCVFSIEKLPSYRIMVFWPGKPARKHRLWDILRWEENIEMDLKELGCGGASLIRSSDVSIGFNRQVLINTCVYSRSVSSGKFVIIGFQEHSNRACPEILSFQYSALWIESEWVVRGLCWHSVGFVTWNWQRGADGLPVWASYIDPTY